MSKDKSCDKVCKKTSIGGQALLGGIMMRGPVKSAMAVRNPRLGIVTEEWDTNEKPVPKIFKLPIFRGMYNMVASFATGMKCIMRSVELSEFGMEDGGSEGSVSDNSDVKVVNDAASDSIAENSVQPSTEKKQKESSKESIDKDKKKKDDNLSKGEMVAIEIVSTVLAIALCVVIFMWLPTQLFTWIINGLVGYTYDGTYGYMIARSAFEGVIRIILFVLYMFAVSFMKDIRETFMYHGAEHKTIFCYEKGLDLTVENVRVQSRLHPRCGTSFMIIILIVGIFIGMFIPEFHIFQNSVFNNILRSVIKIALLPLIVGIGYEIIKFAGRHDNLLVRIISAPGKLMQLISTKEPTDEMIECAITSIKMVIPNDDSDKW